MLSSSSPLRLRADSAESSPSRVTATQPLNRVVFAQHMMKWAPHSTKRLVQLAFVCSTWNDTVSNYGEAVLDCWKRSSDEAAAREEAERPTGNTALAFSLLLRRINRRIPFSDNFDTAAKIVLGKKICTSLNLLPQFLAVGAKPGVVALSEAARSGDLELVDAMLSSKPDRVTKSAALTEAASAGHIHVVKMLLTSGVRIEGKPGKVETVTNGYRPTSTAFRSWEKQERLKSPLMHACERGDIEMCHLLLDAGADRNRVESSNDMFPLLYAVNGKHVEVVRLLATPRKPPPVARSNKNEEWYDDDIDLDLYDQSGTTALMQAAADGSVDIIELLVAPRPRGGDGANVNQTDGAGCTPLIAAAEKGQLGAVRALIGAGARVNLNVFDHDSDIVGDSALIAAARAGHADVVAELVAAGADLEQQCDASREWGGYVGGTALAVAAHFGRFAVVKVLIDAGVDVDAVDDEGVTALMQAAEGQEQRYCFSRHENDISSNTVECIKLLAAAGADLDATVFGDRGVEFDSRMLQTALHIAADHRHPKALAALLDAGASISATDEDGYTALHIAVMPHFCSDDDNCVKCINQLLRNRSRRDSIMNEQSNHGHTALLLAAWNANVVAVRALIEAGADVQIADHEGWTPLSRAARAAARAEANEEKSYYETQTVAKLRECIEVLKAAGGGVEALDGEGHTMLVAAAALGNVEQIEAALALGADVDAVIPESQLTATMVAARFGNAKCLAPLHGAGASLEAVDNDGRTALHWAAAEGKADCVGELLRLGAVADAEDARGRSATMLAMKRDHNDCVKLLSRAGRGAGSRRPRL